MNEIKVSGEVVSIPKIFRTVNNRIICKFTLKVMRDYGAGSVYLPCNLYGEEAEAFHAAAAPGARCGIQGEIIAVGKQIEVAGKMYILQDERSLRAAAAYRSARLNGKVRINVKPLRGE